LHAHLAFGPAFAAVIAARLLGKRSIVKLGNSGEFGDIQSSKRTLRGRLRLAIIRRFANVVIVLDDHMEMEALSAGFDAKQIHRMVNGIDLSMFDSSHLPSHAKESLRLDGKLIILFVGRLSAQKSLSTLIRAVERASSFCAELHLVIVGDGPERSNLEALVRELKLSDRVTFAGLHSDVRVYLSAADIFALPSISEGISNALLEAMSVGLACVASSVGGNSEVLDHGNCGVLLAQNNTECWADAFLDLAVNENRRVQLGKAAQARIKNVYDFGIVGGKYISLYGALIAQQGCKR
jgi:glycosyltransferase involved in cell wall biosynthesis